MQHRQPRSPHDHGVEVKCEDFCEVFRQRGETLQEVLQHGYGDRDRATVPNKNRSGPRRTNQPVRVRVGEYPALAGDGGQVFEQDRPDAVALVGVLDDEGHFGSRCPVGRSARCSIDRMGVDLAGPSVCVVRRVDAVVARCAEQVPV